MTGSEDESRTNTFEFRSPRLEDGADVHRLIRATEPLDLNSLYCYLIICDHFSDTSIVAMHAGRVVGFISAYVLPKRPDTLFIWQVAVDSTMRRRGLAMKMAEGILARECAAGLRYIETTVSPSNTASSRFFETLASRLGTAITKDTYITESMFGGETHEAETLYRIGPFDTPKRA
ncbi:MAG: diaminobutyrate acetyltransferase [Spirochaetes bacterium]|nr:diaminobutyrate acetyltransferase [Spirochaetota bacterium]